ncbi:hypothetical protein ACP4OV_019157 [Aristida adscensionis]
MEFLVLLLVSASLLLPSLGLAVSGQETHELVPLDEPSRPSAHVSVAATELPMVAASVLGAESWLRAHVLARYPSAHIAAIVVGHGVACSSSGHGHDLLLLRLSRAAKNLHHSLVRWGLAGDIKVATVCAPPAPPGSLKRRLYGRHHLPPSPALPPPPQSPPAGATYTPPPPGVPLSFAPNSPPEVVPSVPPTAAAPASSPAAVPASPPPPLVSTRPPFSFTFPSSPPPSVSTRPPFSFTFPSSPPPALVPSSPPEAAGSIAPSAMPPPCWAPPAAAMSPPPWSGEGGGNGGGFWCVAKPTVPEDKLQEAMDYACSQDGVDCQEIAAGGSCFYPDSIASHASYAFNSYWQKMKRIGGSCNFGGAAVLINSDPRLSPVPLHAELKEPVHLFFCRFLCATKMWISPNKELVLITLLPSIFFYHLHHLPEVYLF